MVLLIGSLTPSLLLSDVPETPSIHLYGFAPSVAELSCVDLGESLLQERGQAR